jgi:hypothetical protein
MVAFELEVLAKKMDRFGWERDRGTPAHDRLVTDWMDALQDYPLSEVQAACKAAVLSNPGKIPNEGHVSQQIQMARKRHVALTVDRDNSEPERERVSAETAANILAAAGFGPKRMGDA